MFPTSSIIIFELRQILHDFFAVFIDTNNRRRVIDEHQEFSSLSLFRLQAIVWIDTAEKIKF
jgi:hypothetical protein